MENIAAPDIGNLLKDYVKKHRIYQSAWARKVKLNRKTIAQYLKQPAMQVDTLFNICQALNYNFLKEIAALLPADMPPHADNPLQTRITELEKEKHDLELQVKTFEKALELLSGKK
jgi:transcriptional regulator with XRE-family HTH domain